MRERLIGASVLVIIAVILIPWLVSRAHHPREIVHRLPMPATVSGAKRPYVMPLPSSGAEPGAAARRSAQAAAVHRSRTQPSSPAAQPATTSVPAPTGGWSVQVASFSDRKAAQSLAGRLTRAGFNVYLSPHAVGAKTYYRVRVGPYGDASSARAAAPRVAAVSGTRVVVRGPDNGP